MRRVLTLLSILSMMLAAQVSRAQSQTIRTTYVKLGSSSALLMEPATPGPRKPHRHRLHIPGHELEPVPSSGE